ncbi:hypothetical protein WUBG_03190 [Wuchereria bancrofti]|uniref:Uncharacterized protein n=1 Tax=Wuchereria bancrofti TaxID=6293 RepID=J9FEW5_WUCBA|nr:hypothetical protein WUBG_03190 [Wuchereria bancrofti]
MTKELTTFGEKTEKLDFNRVIIISTLPIKLLFEPREQFNQTIFRLINLKFNLGNDVIDRIIRYPLIESIPDQVIDIITLTDMYVL